jgi:hypothetical protein
LSDVRRQCPVLTHYLVSGHGMQINDLDGDEADGLDECQFVYLLLGTPVTNEMELSLGICAMDYRGDDPYQDCNTPGLIVDDVCSMNGRVFLC